MAAAEAPLGSLWGSKLHETRKTISMTGHFTAFVMWPMNVNFFNRLPKYVQQVLLEEGRKAGEYMTRLTLEQQQSYVDRFKAAGVTFVTDVDLANADCAGKRWWLFVFGGLAKVLAIQLIGAVDEVHLHGSNLQGKQCGYSANTEKRAERNAARAACFARDDQCKSPYSAQDKARGQTYIYVLPTKPAKKHGQHWR